MQIIIERKDYKTRRQMDIIGVRLLKAGKSLAHTWIGAPNEHISVHCKPSEAQKMLGIIKGK